MNGMKCPYCYSPSLKVVDKRPSGEAIRRRRACEKCDKRFTTYERVSLGPFMVIKKDGRREEFDRQKILSGFLKACEKRPIPREQIEQMADELEAEIRNTGEEVPTTIVGDKVMEKLRSLDKIAYVRFASVYMDFKSIAAFEKALKGLK